MARIKFYLDKRRACVGGLFPLKINLSHKGKNVLFPVRDVRLQECQWDSLAERVVRHPLCGTLNSVLQHARLDMEDKLLLLQRDGRLEKMSMSELREELGLCRIPVKVSVCGSLWQALKSFGESRLAAGTRGLYEQTGRRLRAWLGDGCERLEYEDVTRDWLREFDAWLGATCCANTRSIHMRNLRAVFNHAIDEGLTTLYPFRRWKIKTERTRKRSLPVERLREFVSMPVLEWEKVYQDMFMLVFYLCGVNMVDLCRVKDLCYGRLEYKRAKTGKPYSIKVEPEAQEIIDRYRGKGQLLDILDHYANYQDFAQRMNDRLKTLGGVKMEKRATKDGKTRAVSVKETRWPGLSVYWARHTWATIAASLDIPKETIAAALGHSDHSVTDIYISFDQSKVDRANRAVIDWVLYGKSGDRK